MSTASLVLALVRQLASGAHQPCTWRPLQTSWLLAPAAGVTIMLITHGPVIAEGNSLWEMTNSQSVNPVTRSFQVNGASKSYSRIVAPG